MRGIIIEVVCVSFIATDSIKQFEDTKGIIIELRSRNSKDRQNNGQEEKRTKNTNNCLQNITHKLI